MSERYKFTTVCGLDQIGERYYIYDCDHHAGGCAYEEVISAGEQQYRVIHYPEDGQVEEHGEKLPCLSLADLQSYFTETPTEAMTEVLKKSGVEDLPFAQLLLVTQSGVVSGAYEASCENVTKDGVEHTDYDMFDFVGDDIWSMLEHIVDEVWHSYHYKLGDIEDDF